MRPSNAGSLTALLLVVVLVSAACAGSETTESGSEAETGTTASASSTTADATTAPPTVSPSSTSAPTSTEVATTVAPETAGVDPAERGVPGELIDDGALRLAPASWDLPPLHYFGNGVVGGFGNTAGWVTTFDGSVTALADTGAGLVAQQQQWDNTAIVRIVNGATEVLIEGGPDEFLELEGAVAEGVDGGTDGAAVVYFQRFLRTDSPETTRSTLERLDLGSGAVSSVAEIGGWESGTGFNAIFATDRTVGLWNGEGFHDIRVYDLASGNLVFDQGGPRSECFDGEPGCIVYEAATLLDGEIYGVRSMWSDEEQIVDSKGVFRFDPDSGLDELVVAYPWDNGTWYVEDLFAAGGRLVLSLADEPPGFGDGGGPLPALILDPAAPDQAVTSPLAAFARPAYLS
jgi:hypothetical protein